MMGPLTFMGLPLCTRSNNFGMAAAVRALRDKGITADLQKRSASFSDVGDVTLTQLHRDMGPGNLTNFTQFLDDTERIRSAVAGLSGEG